jgi:hypothetical protein
MPTAAHQAKLVERNFGFLKHKLNDRKVSIGLLRVCQLINHEARRVFYGGNELRYIGINGWIAANAFPHTIGRDIYHSLNSINLTLPFEVSDRGRHRIVGAIVPALSTRATLRIAIRIPFNVPDSWACTYMFINVCIALGKTCTDLISLDLILPS